MAEGKGTSIFFSTAEEVSQQFVPIMQPIKGCEVCSSDSSKSLREESLFSSIMITHRAVIQHKLLFLRVDVIQNKPLMLGFMLLGFLTSARS